jgi:dienelactone hydrolase
MSEQAIQPGLSMQLPELLRDFNGKPVETAGQWKRFRKDILKRVQDEMYGALPATPPGMAFEVTSEFKDALGGTATCRIVRIHFDDTDALSIQLMLFTPNKRRGKVPCFLTLGFCGNDSLTDDVRIPERSGWNFGSCKGRGSLAAGWQLERTIARGYAVAHICYADIDEDRIDHEGGIRAWEDRIAGKPKQTINRGSVAAWAWGVHRAVDYLITDAKVNGKRIAIMGHSRNGKAALLAGATDERIALVIPHQSGCGGAAPSRGAVGEKVSDINKRFPHWFNAKFKAYSDATDRLPFDQHHVIACIAPRPVLISNAVQDTWANPDGQFEALRAAQPAWALLGKNDSGIPATVEQGKVSLGRQGTFLRPGVHAVTADDWAAFLDFADRWL